MDRSKLAIPIAVVVLVSILSASAFVGLLAYPLPVPARGGSPSEPAREGSTGPTPFALGPAGSSVHWNDLTPALNDSPPCTGDTSTAYDPILGDLVLFGGIGTCSDPSQFLNETWTFNGISWTNVSGSLSNAPSPRFGAAMAYDPASKALVLFGGASVYGFASLGDTWSFNGTWTNLSAGLSPSPTPVSHPSMVYDPVLSALVLVGGVLGPGDPQTNATWEFKSSGWTQIAHTGGLPALQDPTLWFDGATSSVLLFGGSSDVYGSLSGTWSFTATGWTEIATGYTPQGEFDGSALYIGASMTPVLFGGYTVGSPVFNPNGFTYLFTSGDWVNLTAGLSMAPSARGAAGAAWFTPLNESVLFGGRTNAGLVQETWTLSGAVPPPALNVSLDATPSYFEAGGAVTLTTTTAGGGGAFTYAYSGLPSSCATENKSQITCSGVATGAYLVQVTVTDTDGQNASAVTVFVVAPLPGAPTSPVSVSLTASPSYVTVGSSVTLTTQVGGAVGVISYGYSGLPAGCSSQNSSSIVCASIPEGVYLATVRVTTTSGQSNVSAAAFTAVPPPPSPPVPVPPLVVGLAASPSYLVAGNSVTLTTTVVNRPASVTYAYAGLPAGCAGTNSSTITCAAVPNGSYLVTVHVTQPVGPNGSAQMIVVAFPPTPSSGGGTTSTPTVFGLSLSDFATVTLALAVVALALAIVAVLRPRRPAAPPPT